MHSAVPHNKAWLFISYGRIDMYEKGTEGTPQNREIAMGLFARGCRLEEQSCMRLGAFRAVETCVCWLTSGQQSFMIATRAIYQRIPDTCRICSYHWHARQAIDWHVCNGTNDRKRVKRRRHPFGRDLKGRDKQRQQ